MIARSITIVAPIVNEWAAPLPIIMMFGFSILGLLMSFTFPNDQEFTQGNLLEEKTYNLNEKHGENASDVTYHNLSADLKNSSMKEQSINDVITNG